MFSTPPKPLLAPTKSCRFAHSSKDFIHSAPEDLIFCVVWDTNSSHGERSSKLFSSTDFFVNDKHVVNFPGGNWDSDGVIALAIVGKFAVAAVKDLNPGSGDEMLLFVSIDGETWAKDSSRMHHNFARMHIQSSSLPPIPSLLTFYTQRALLALSLSAIPMEHTSSRACRIQTVTGPASWTTKTSMGLKV